MEILSEGLSKSKYQFKTEKHDNPCKTVLGLFGERKICYYSDLFGSYYLVDGSVVTDENIAKVKELLLQHNAKREPVGPFC